MAQIHNALNRGPWSAAAAAIVGESKAGAGVERLGETLTPTLNLFEPGRPDWAIYRREQLLQLHATQANVAAEFSCIVFEPPLVKSSLLVIEYLEVVATGQVLVGYDIRPAGAVEVTLTKQFKDTRSALTGQRPRSKVYADTNAASALTGPFFRYTPTAGVSTIIKGPWVLIGENLLGNQNVLILEHGTVNLALAVTAHGYERELQPSEQRFNR